VRIQGHLQDDVDTAQAAPTSQRKAVRTNEDLLHQFGDIVDAARAGRALPTTLTHYLHNARQRLNFFLRSQEHRLSTREAPDTGAAAILELNGQRQEVTVVDRSPFGVGVRSEAPVDTEQMAQLYCPDKPQGAKTFECLTVYCRREDDAYHVGLEIVTSKLS